MAKADWCTVAPMSGKENGTITISAPAHTGRAERSTVVTVQAANGAKPSAKIQVSQAGVPVVTTIEANKPDIPGGQEKTVVINGTSNSSTLKLADVLFMSDGTDGANATYGANMALKVEGNTLFDGKPTKEAITIPNDIGASRAYDFTIEYKIFPNPWPMTFYLGIGVTDESGDRKLCRIRVLSGASSLSVDKRSLSLQPNAGGDTVDISSNDDWTVS